MTHSHVKQGLAAACLVGLGGAFSAHAATVQTASEDTTGEAMAKAFYTQNRAEFNSNPPAITALQVKAALAEGERDQYASPPQLLGDGGQWTLPWRSIQSDGTEPDRNASLVQSISDGGNWTLSWRLIQRDGTE